MKIKQVISLLLALAISLGCMATLTFAQQEQFLVPVTDMAAAAQSETPMYLYARDSDGVVRYMRQARGAAASSHGYAEKVTTTSPYSLYTTDDLSEADVYSVIAAQCDEGTEYLLQFHDGAGNKDYILYIMTSGVGPNTPSTETHAKHHFLWDEEKQYFYQMEGDVAYVLVMKNLSATYAKTTALPAMTQNEWRITAVPAVQLENEGVYPMGLACHNHSYTKPTPVASDTENHRLDCLCGAEGTVLQPHSYGADGSCSCGKRQAVSLNAGLYFLKATISGTTYYFRQTISGESVTSTTPYSLYTTAKSSEATCADVILEQTGGFSIAYPYNNTLARVYVYDVGSNGNVDTGVNTSNTQANHHFSWDQEAGCFYQMEGTVKYVLAMKQLTNSKTGTNEVRMLAVPESSLSSTVAVVRPEAHTQHSCDNWTVDTPPTTSTTGLKTGTCSLCGREIQEVIPAIVPNFSGQSLSLQDNFALNFYVAEESFADGVYSNPYAVFELEGETTTVTAYTLKDGCYVFTFDNIAPDLMGKTITATICADKQDGTRYSVSKTYSVAQYCYDALAMEYTSDALRTLLVDTLHFGAACQLFRNPELEEKELVDAALTQQQLAWGSGETIRQLENCRDFGSNSGSVKWYGVSALMGDSIQMRLYFTALNKENLTVQAQSAVGQWTLTNEQIKTKDGLYYVDFGCLNPAQMQEKVSFTVYQGDTAVSSTLHYSLDSYAAVWTQKSDANPRQVEMVKAMIRYGDAAKAYKERTYDLETDVLYLGRTYLQGDTQWFNWSASGFSVQFEGSGLKALIASNAPNAANYAYLKVYVDGVEQEDVLLDEKMQTVTLAEGLDPNVTHRVEVRKRNSPRSSTAGLVQLEVTGGKKLAPANANDRLIEFVGDSLTVGYSAADTNKTATAWSTATEDATKTYSKQVADGLNADYMVTAISGRGVVMNNSGGDGYLLPEIYPQQDIYNLPDVPYDFALQPQVIVINLGTNDATNADLNMDTFQNGVYDFIHLVRQKNPNAQIIWAYGLRTDRMTTQVAAAIQAAVAQHNAQGDAKVHYVPLAVAQEMHLNHPTAAAYAPAGETLIEKIKEITGW